VHEGVHGCNRSSEGVDVMKLGKLDPNAQHGALKRGHEVIRLAEEQHHVERVGEVCTATRNAQEDHTAQIVAANGLAGAQTVRQSIGTAIGPLSICDFGGRFEQSHGGWCEGGNGDPNEAGEADDF